MPLALKISKKETSTSEQTNQKFEWHITATKEVAAITLLTSYAEKQNINLSNAEIKKAISKGALWLTPVKNKKQTQRLRRVKKSLVMGDELHFYYNSNILETKSPSALLIKDLKDYSVWYKPYGMLSQGSKWSDHCTVARFAQLNLPNERPCFIVHRLDRAATGLILIAHTKKAAKALSGMFEHHKLEKHYQIIVQGNHNTRPQPDVIELEIDNKKARSTFTTLTFDSELDRTLIDVKIDSGRKHQIRKHAASIGMPVVGDRLHGEADETEPLNLQLCAVSLRFECPLASLTQPKTEHKALLNIENNITENNKHQSLEIHDDCNMRYFELPDKLKPQLRPVNV